MRNKPMLLSLMLSLVVILAACGSDPTATHTTNQYSYRYP